MFKRRTSWICQFCDSKEKNLDVFCRYCFRNRPLSLPSLLPSAATSSTEDYDGKGGFYSTEQIKQNETFLQHAMNEVKFEKCNEMDKSFLINKFNTKQNGRQTIQSASKDGSQPVYRIMRPCGLCMVGFPTAQLTKTVSNRLVQQWKETHNTSSSSSSSSSAFPSSSSSYISSRKGFKSNSNQYDIVHICVFCFQFFDDSSSTNKFKDIDALQRELLPHNYSKENMLEYEARKIESTFKRPISRMKLKISKSALQNKKISAILSAEKQSFLLRSTCNNTEALLSPLPKMKPYQISSKKRVFITEAPKRRGSSQEAIGPESTTSRGRGSFEKVRNKRNQNPRLKSSSQDPHKVLGVKREAFKTQFGRRKEVAVPAPATRIPPPKLLTGAKEENVEKGITASRTYRLNLSTKRVLRPLIIKLGNNETVEAKRSLINAESMEAYMHQKVELKRAIDKRKLIEEEALQVLNFSSSRLNNAPDDVIETEGVELIEKKEILLPTNPTADFSALIIGSGEQGPEDHSNYLMDFEPDESNGDLVVPPSSNVPISPSEAIEVGCLRASSALRRTTSSSSSRYIRGGSLSNIMVAVVEGNPRPPRTPKLRSRVGDGIEPNFLEVFDENDLPPRID